MKHRDRSLSREEVSLHQHCTTERANHIVEVEPKSPYTKSQTSCDDPDSLESLPTSHLPEQARFHDNGANSNAFDSHLRNHTTEKRATHASVRSMLMWQSGFKALGDCILPPLIAMEYALLRIAKGFNNGVETLTGEFGKVVNPKWDPNTPDALDAQPYFFGKLTRAESSASGYIACLMAVIFGSVHCLAWHFEFSRKPEQFLWRTSSIIIICLPLYAMIMLRIARSLIRLHRRTFFQRVDWAHYLIYGLYLPFTQMSKLLCMIARLLLLIEMFVLLRKPDAGIYTTVD
ncbi:hypothetical protein H2248_002797 [Termitomyces sp. 'cryptogamus']|nr:hypothetical protein H2248_002797 [Termitomyces sp. 'cryptogamus']